MKCTTCKKIKKVQDVWLVHLGTGGHTLDGVFCSKTCMDKKWIELVQHVNQHAWDDILANGHGSIEWYKE